eukprot:TRINITY_DN1082_c0_g1_i1.p1 TRINITY_DN1082_c0_g1~~TRINITY_DN1082_c0_g1_i1.p1  ORF type:complete len:335 (+),score=100.59 TRINITY_DN1082_c0_g1_i1:95-1099(+)
MKWGILGTGKIAQDFATALGYLPDAQIVAVGSRSQRPADEFGDRFKVPARFPSYEELATSSDAEVIYVSTIHPLHKETSILCLKNKKHVLCEKPVTMNAKELEEVIKVAKENNVFFMEAMWTRFFPAIQKVKELVDAGQIGDVKLILADFGFVNNAVPRLSEPQLGGGALLDIGIYPISLSSYIYGSNPTSICTSAKISDGGVDEQSVTSLVFGKDQMANIALTFLAETPKEFTIVGSKGRLKIHSPFWCSTKITLTTSSGEQVLNFDLPKQKEGDSFNFTNSIGMQFEAQHVQDMIKKNAKESDTITIQQSLDIMKTLDSIRSQWGLKFVVDQ